MNRLNGDHDKAKSWIESSFAHMSTYYGHHSLGARLEIQIVGSIEYDPASIGIHDVDTNSLTSKTTRHLRQTGANLVVYLIGNPAGGVLGKAGCIGCVCMPNEPSLHQYWNPFFGFDRKHNTNMKMRTIIGNSSKSNETNLK